jgi:4-hydroxy-tetrahydrodipicolinate reductase
MSALPIWIHGVTGRMGQSVASLVDASEDLAIRGVVEVRDHARSIDWAGARGVGVARRASDLDAGAVVIDFSRSGAVGPLLESMKGSGAALVSGTTGLEAGERDLLDVYSEERPVFYAENMSYGICLLVKMLRDAAPLFAPLSDIEIVEFHHRHKRDCPSGTALALAQAIRPTAEPAGDDPGQIQIHSIRAGGIPGIHEVHTASDEEVLTFTHRAISRDVFARGAIHAARFVASQKRGLFGMNHLLEQLNAEHA